PDSTTELGAPSRRLDNRSLPAIRPRQVALLHAEDQRSRVGAMSQRMRYVILTCYEDQEILLEDTIVELICYIAAGTLIWYMILYQNNISSEGWRAAIQHMIFPQPAKRRPLGANTTGLAYV